MAEGEKRKSELKVTIERMKLESQMKIESMMEANEKLEEEIEGLHERILELEKMRSTLINDYEFQILLLKNEMEKLRDECHQREDELRANLNEKIVVKNKEIARFAERIKQETEELLRKHRDRVTAIEKEYEELKRVITQKTSLPEDIEVANDAVRPWASLNADEKKLFTRMAEVFAGFSNDILIILGLILANGLFSGAELAIVASRRHRLEQLAHLLAELEQGLHPHADPQHG